MMDPRFDTRPDSYLERLRTVEQKAREFLNGSKETVEFVQELSDWWNLLKKKKRKEPSRLGRLSENETPTKHLKKGPPEILAVLHRVCTVGASEEAWEDVAASLLLGRALGCSIVSRPSLKTFAQAAFFLEINHLARENFLAVFQEKLTSAEPLKNRWVRLLQKENEPLDCFINQGVPFETLKEKTKEQNLLSNLDPFSCWNEQFRPCNIPVLLEMKLDLLSILDVPTFINFIERLPLHEIIKTILLEPRVSRDQDLIQKMIANASPAYGPDNKWTKKVISIFLPQLIMQYAVKLKNSIRYSSQQLTGFEQTTALNSVELNAFCKEEMPNWFRKVFGEFLKREDGEFIIKQFSVYLVSTQLNSNEFTDPENPSLIAMNIIEELLRESKIGVNWLPEEWKGKDHETSALLTYCVLDSKDPKRQWDWYVDLLKRRNENTSLGISPFSQFPDWIGNLIGYRLVLLPEPLEAFKDAWRSLFPERLSARFRIEHDSLSASLHLLEIGKGALRCLVSNVETHPEGFSLTKEFWIFLYHCYESLYLGYSFQMSQPILRAFITLFAYVPLVFKADWKEAILQAEGILRLDAGFGAYAFKAISQNGVNITYLSEAVSEIFGGVGEFVNNLEILKRSGFKLYPEFFSYDQLISEWDSVRSRMG
ncbi:MAG: hypothetical protein M1532_01415 [Nitrospirae bacterium]|uniref:Uncharacterized protein n=2 Tax=Leptospirillum ferriphilum TaxID=178606 RepID=A0A059Y284_9BACT|nr:hypothetical protein Y981_05525 [Leptospirillum ferriphilum YSK]MCL5259285.1 hypothetical protein [Nitrospirota bacterium]